MFTKNKKVKEDRLDMVNLNNVHLNWWYVVGSILMIISFIMVVSEHAKKIISKRKKSIMPD